MSLAGIVCIGLRVETTERPSGAMSVTSRAALWGLLESFTIVLSVRTVALPAVTDGVVTKVLQGSR